MVPGARRGVGMPGAWGVPWVENHAKRVKTWAVDCGCWEGAKGREGRGGGLDGELKWTESEDENGV